MFFGFRHWIICKSWGNTCRWTHHSAEHQERSSACFQAWYQCSVCCGKLQVEKENRYFKICHFFQSNYFNSSHNDVHFWCDCHLLPCCLVLVMYHCKIIHIQPHSILSFFKSIYLNYSNNDHFWCDCHLLSRCLVLIIYYY